MKTFSSWNQQKFNEYLHKSNQYEINDTFKSNSNTISGHKASFNIYDFKNSSINKQQEIDNFHSPPGVSLSDENHFDYNQMDKDEKFLSSEFDKMKNQAKANMLLTSDPFKLTNNTFSFNNPNLFLNNEPVRTECDFKVHGDDFKMPIPTNPSLGSLQKAYVQAAYNLKSYLNSKQNMKPDICTSMRNDVGSNANRLDKSTQTPDFISRATKSFKTLEKSNQTNNIIVKHNSVSTDPIMIHSKDDHIDPMINSINKNLENKSDINNIKFKNQAVNSNLLTKTASTITGDKINTTIQKHEAFTQHYSDSENENEIGNDSNPDEFTLISKTNSKFASFNEILGNLGLHLQTSEESLKNLSFKKSKFADDKDNHLPSFWDNPLEQLELKSETQTSLEKTLFVDFAEKSGDNIRQSLREAYESLGTGKDNSVDNQKTQNDVNTCLKTNNDFVDQLKTKSYVMEKKPLSKSYGYRYSTSRKSNFINSGMKFSKSFYLSPYDDLVKSHFNPTDRRIKSVSSKNGSTILIEGPINTYDNYSVPTQSKSKVYYRCTVSSCHQESLDKCVNYLKETFPNTYLRNGIKNVLK